MKSILIILASLCCHNLYCQGISSILDKSTNPGEVLVEFDNRWADIKGSYYLLKDWQIGDMVLNSGISVRDQWINYDFEYDNLEVKLENHIKVIPLWSIDNFIVKPHVDDTRLFQPCYDYLLENSIPLAGVCEVLDSNYFGLIIKYTSDIKEATYVPALDMGKKEDEIIVKKKYYLTFGNSAIEIPKKEKCFYDLYAPYKDSLNYFVKEKKLNFKNKEDLKMILNYLNASKRH